MCIKIVKEDQVFDYDTSKPLESQTINASEIVVSYSHKDSTISRFVGEIERIAKNGTPWDVRIKVIHNDNLKGARVKKQTKILEEQIKINELIKLMVTSHKNADKELESLINMCFTRNLNVK
jgi:hypothetical protein